MMSNINVGDKFNQSQSNVDIKKNTASSSVNLTSLNNTMISNFNGPPPSDNVSISHVGSTHSRYRSPF